jgi:hypothetical protein
MIRHSAIRAANLLYKISINTLKRKNNYEKGVCIIIQLHTKSGALH